MSKPEPREPRTRRATAERRAQLIELGLRAFGQHAYDDVSIDAIAQSASISKGLLYHYFPTKRAFYAACIEASREQFLAFVSPPDHTAPLERIDYVLDAYLEFVRVRGASFVALMRSGIGVDVEIVRIVERARTSMLELIAGAVESQLSTPHAPWVRLALRGWIGYVEAISIAWVEALSAAQPAPSPRQLRAMLTQALWAVTARSDDQTSRPPRS